MAIILQKKDLTESQISYITNILTISPKESFFQKKRQWAQKRFKKSEDAEETDTNVQFYQYNETTEQLRVPYRIGISIKGYNSNLLIQHPTTKIEFKYQLYESQIDIYKEAVFKLQTQNMVNLNIYTGA